MKLKELEGELKEGNKIYKGLCHDCGTHVEVSAKLTEDGAIEIEGGSVYRVNRGVEVIYFFKCDACFKEDTTLRNYEECEVYSRVVGYLRPIKQWNKGKKEEFRHRKVFVNTR